MVEFDTRAALDGLLSARSAPAGEVAGVGVVQLARDVVLAEQEFRRSAGYLSGETAESEGRVRGLSDWAKGLGWGVLAAASVTPWGTLGKLGRLARSGDAAFDVVRAAEGVSGAGGGLVEAGRVVEAAGDVAEVGRGAAADVVGFADDVDAWRSNPTAEMLPIDFVRRFAEFDRASNPTTSDINDLATSIASFGFREPLVLEVDPLGRAVLIEGNHRLAAADVLYLNEVPVRVITSSPGRLGERGANALVREGLGSGNLLKPSEVFERIGGFSGGRERAGTVSAILARPLDEFFFGPESRFGTDIPHNPKTPIGAEAGVVYENIQSNREVARILFSRSDSPKAGAFRVATEIQTLSPSNPRILEVLELLDDAIPLENVSSDLRSYVGLLRLSGAVESRPAVWDASGSGGVLSAKEVGGKYVVPNMSRSHIDSPIYSVDRRLYGQPRRSQQVTDYNRVRLTNSILQDNLAILSSDDASVILGFPGWLDVTNARSLNFVAGTMVDSIDEAFELAVKRGRKYIFDPTTGRKINVPDELFESDVFYGVTPGRDITNLLDTTALDEGASISYAGRGAGDEVLKEIYKEQGFDAPAELISEEQFNNLLLRGFIPLYRGIDMSNGGLIPRPDDVFSNIRFRARSAWERSGRSIEEFLNIAAANRVRLTDVSLADQSNWVKWKVGLLPPGVKRNTAQELDRRLRVVYGDEAVDSVSDMFTTVDQHVKDFAEGIYYPGVGSHGSGTYMTPNIERAQGYANNRIDLTSRGLIDEDGFGVDFNGVVVGAALSPSARIMGPHEYQNLARTIESFNPRRIEMDGLEVRIPGDLRGVFRNVDIEGVIGDEDLVAMAARNDIDLSELGSTVEALQIKPTYADMGRLIAALGYDGYVPYGSVFGYHKPEYVILNRQVLKVLDRPVNPVYYHRESSLNEVLEWTEWR